MNQSELLNLKERAEKELVSLIQDLGKDGGMVSPSVYATAQYLRIVPPKDPMSTIEWLLAQQQSDGGWGDVSMPVSRDVPTIATILALEAYQESSNKIKQAQKAGIDFIHNQKKFWKDLDEDELMIGVEVILPNLVEEAQGLGISLSGEAYQQLLPLREKKFQFAKKLGVHPGTPIAFSWEAFDFAPDRGWMDSSGGIGSSSTATLSWIKKAKNHMGLKPDIEKAEAYLKKAARSTPQQGSHILPFIWPITYFEIFFPIFAIIQAKLDLENEFNTLIKKKCEGFSERATKIGFGHNEIFISDVDDTAVALEVLDHFNLPISTETLEPYIKDRKIFTYPGEFRASTSAISHAIHAMLSFDLNFSLYYPLLYELQRAGGYWKDKWHISKFYATSHALIALKKEASASFEKGINFLEESQHADGSWGRDASTSYLESSYVLLSLYELRESLPKLSERLNSMIEKASRYMLQNFHSKSAKEYPTLWIGKELYSVYRIDRSFELSCVLRIILDKLTKMEEGKNE